MKTNYNKIEEKNKAELTEENKQVESKEVETNPIKQAVVVNCDRLNIRKEPSINAQVERVINKGTNLIIGKTINGFVEVYNKKGTETEGYVMEKYIEEV